MRETLQLLHIKVRFFKKKYDLTRQPYKDVLFLVLFQESPN